MDADDDMLVLIVGDDTDEKQLEVKEDESDGQANNVEEMESLLQGEADYLDDDDAEYVPKEEKKSKKTWKTKTVADIRKTRKKPVKKPIRTRTRTLKPSEWKSYVQDLLKKRPELIHNEQLLVETLANLMKKTKAPAPPEGFYRIEEKTAQYVCETCDAVDTTIKGITRHYQTQHGELYLVCYACGANFRYGRTLYRHEQSCKAPDALVVLKARGIAVGARGDNRPFLAPKPTTEDRRRKKNEQQNRLRHKKAKSYPCSYCPASFLDPRALDAHENLHRGERPYVCDFCMATYGSYNAFTCHRATHEQKQYICDHCGNSYKNKRTLKDHIKMHNPASKFACEQCDRKFSDKRSLKLHMRKFHDNLPPPLPCQICPKRYSHIRSLKNHMRKEHGMELITRNMFIRSFPKLTEVELDEAKVITKEDVKAFPYVVQPKKSPIKERAKGEKKLKS